MKTLLLTLTFLFSAQGLSATETSASSDWAQSSELAWGNEPVTFISKNENGYGRLIEAIPTKSGEEMTFIHYDITPDAIIYKFTTRGGKLKRSPLSWLLNEPFSYVHQRNGPNGEVLTIASYVADTGTLVISPYMRKGKSQANFAYEEIDSETMEHLKMIASLPGGVADGRGTLHILGR